MEADGTPPTERKKKMNEFEFEGVIIDGAVPRNAYERAVAVYDHLITMPGVVMTDHLESLDPGAQSNITENLTADVWVEMEDEIIDEIEALLPQGYTVRVGEQQPGDVVIAPTDAEPYYGRDENVSPDPGDHPDADRPPGTSGSWGER